MNRPDKLPYLTVDSFFRPELRTRAGWRYDLGPAGSPGTLARVDEWVTWLRTRPDRVGQTTDIDDLLDARLALRAEGVAA